jgi:F0F1-type ATP synthase assembly protein I
MTDPEEPKKPPSGAMRAAGAGLELAATLVGCCLLGYWIDTKLNTSPWAFLILAVFGIVGGLYNMIRRELRQAVLPPSHKKKGEDDGGPGGGDRK